MIRSICALLLAFILLFLSGCAAVVVGGVAAGASAAHDRRPFGIVLADRNLQLSAYDNLNRDKELALRNNVSIIVYNGTMLLIGEVRNEALRQRAEQRVSGFEGTERLINELDVREPEGFWSRRRDSIITGHVKTALLDIVDREGFDPMRVNVSTAHRIVYLMGLVSRSEAERVVQIARNVNGVERVVKVFEYTD